MAADPQNHAFPAEIAKAVVTVMGALGTLQKDHQANIPGQGSYSFASIDDFIAHVRGHCIDAGLFIIPNEAEADLRDVVKGDGKAGVVWWSKFSFTLVHDSGASYGPIFKSVMVHAGGAQSAGAAQSYALKQLMRGLFLIPTGEGDDPDKEKMDISSKGEQQSDLQKTANAIRKKLREARDIAELGLRWSDSEMQLSVIQGQAPVAYDFLKKEYDTRKAELETA